MTPEGYYTLGEVLQLLEKAKQEYGAQDSDICVIDVYECIRIIPPTNADITIDLTDAAQPLAQHRN